MEHKYLWSCVGNCSVRWTSGSWSHYIRQEIYNNFKLALIFHWCCKCNTPKIYKGDPRTCAIFIPAWGSNWRYFSFPAIRITMICQVRMYCGLSVKINTRETQHVAPRSWTHFVCVCFCVWSTKTRILLIWAPWLTRPLHGADVTAILRGLQALVLLYSCMVKIYTGN